MCRKRTILHMKLWLPSSCVACNEVLRTASAIFSSQTAQPFWLKHHLLKRLVGPLPMEVWEARQ